jgi:hypothetical protein
VHQEWAEWTIKLKAESVKLKAYKRKPFAVAKGFSFIMCEYVIVGM